MRILMVDDELHGAAPWKIAIDRAHLGEVEVCSRADDAMRYIAHCDDPDLVLIYDLMMPTPAGRRGVDTEYGTRTGRLVHEAFRQRFPNQPAFLLSGATDREAFLELGKGPNDYVCPKERVMPAELVERVRRAITAPGK